MAHAVADPNRLAALRATGLLDSLSEEAFDRFTRLAAALLHAPASLVTLIDADRAFFKSTSGLPAQVREAPLSTNVCKHVVAAKAPLVLDDARLDAPFHENPLVQDAELLRCAGTQFDPSVVEALNAVLTEDG